MSTLLELETKIDALTAAVGRLTETVAKRKRARFGPVKVHILKRDRSPNFYTQYQDPTTGKLVRKSTGTPDELDALKLAEDLEREVNDRFRWVYKRTDGTISPKLRFEVMKSDGFHCRLCGCGAQDNVTLDVDHYVPKARGGTDDPINLWTLCNKCNAGKSDSII